MPDSANFDVDRVAAMAADHRRAEPIGDAPRSTITEQADSLARWFADQRRARMGLAAALGALNDSDYGLQHKLFDLHARCFRLESHHAAVKDALATAETERDHWRDRSGVLAGDLADARAEYAKAIAALATLGVKGEALDRLGLRDPAGVEITDAGKAALAAAPAPQPKPRRPAPQTGKQPAAPDKVARRKL